jgi:hypothetical protein
MTINCIGTDTSIIPQISLLSREYPRTRLVHSKTAARAVFSVYSQASDLIIIGEKISPAMRGALKRTFLTDGHFTLVSETKHRVVIKNGSALAAEVANKLSKLMEK